MCTCEGSCGTESRWEGRLKSQTECGKGKRKHTVTSISTVARADIIVVGLIGGNGVTNQENVLLISYALNIERSGRIGIDRASSPRLTGDGQRDDVIVSRI